MRIFIYAQGRSGGNTIQKALAEMLNLRPCWVKEFDNAIIDPVAFEETLKEDNIIIKLHLWQCVGNFDNTELSTLTSGVPPCRKDFKLGCAKSLLPS